MAQTDSSAPFETAADVPEDPQQASEESAETALQPARLREGLHLTDAVGRFEATVEGPIFVDTAGHRLAGLENLNLQRVARTVREAEDPSLLRWKVSGVITEYEGRNFLLIERATYSTPER